MKKILITGGAGFIGSHAVESVLKNTDWDVVVLDRLDISGNLKRLTELSRWEQEGKRVKFVWWDLKAGLNNQICNEIGTINYIWHLAASSHVDRSITDPLSFVMDNVVGTCNILEYTRDINPEKFICFGTDEVFGPAPVGVNYKEWDRYKSSNPYAASKAGAEELCIAYENTYGLSVVVTHTMNVFGERQHPEKFIPMTISKILAEDEVLIHADPTKTISGTRKWIHAKDVCKALRFLTAEGKSGEKYNIVGEEITNLEMAKFIAEVLDRPLIYKMVNFHSSRPGHDLRYSMDGTKLKDMGLDFEQTTMESLRRVIEWYCNHREWIIK